MKGFILAAGFGTRLRPLTETTPKPLIPVAGLEPLFFALTKFYDYGIRSVSINSHYLADKIQTSIRDFAKLLPDMKLEISHEEKILGSGGGLLKVLHEETGFEEGLLVMNGDTLAGIDLTKLPTDRSSMAISFNDKFFARYSPLWIDKNNNFAGNSAPSYYRKAHFLGVHFLSPENIEFLKAETPKTARQIDLFAGIYQPLLAANLSVQAQEFLLSPEEFWFDLTDKGCLDEAESVLTTKYAGLWDELLKWRHSKK